MKLAGSAVLAAPRDRVWDALQDPAVLVRTIPGCERLETIGPDMYKMTVHAGVASIKGVYEGQVALTDPVRHERFVLKARGKGAPGTVDASVQVVLSDDEGGGTRVDYEADAVVGGMAGGVGQRMLTAVAKKTADEFFSAVERHLTGEPVAPEPVAPEGGVVPEQGTSPEAEAVPEAPAVRGPAGVFTRPPQRPAPSGRGALLAAFGIGAGVAFGGVVIGWLLGRAGRRS